MALLARSGGISRSWRAGLLRSLFGPAVPFSRSVGKPLDLLSQSFGAGSRRRRGSAKPHSSPCHAEQSALHQSEQFASGEGDFSGPALARVGCWVSELRAVPLAGHWGRAQPVVYFTWLENTLLAPPAPVTCLGIGRGDRQAKGTCHRCSRVCETRGTSWRCGEGAGRW